MRNSFLAICLCVSLVLPAEAALKAGDKAPDFSAEASLAGKQFKFSLEDALRKGPVLFTSIPQHLQEAAIWKLILLRRIRRSLMPLVPQSSASLPTTLPDSMLFRLILTTALVNSPSLQIRSIRSRPLTI